MRIEIASNERVFTAGKTGSGKTYLNRELCRGVSRLVVLDPKGTLRDTDDKPADELWHLEEWSERARKKLDEGKPVRVRVPAPLRQGNRGGSWDNVLWSIYDAGNCILEIDEMYGVVPPGGHGLPDSLNAIYTRGRELGIGVYACTQRPVWVPLQAKSEADWFFCFRLMLADDRRSMSEIMGPDVMYPIPETDEHGFWTFNAAWNAPQYTSELIANPRGREAA